MLFQHTFAGTQPVPQQSFVHIQTPQTHVPVQQPYPPPPVSLVPAVPIIAAPAIRRFGFMGTTWFPPDRTVRAGVVGYRVFVDVRDMLSIVTTSSAALRNFYVSWFDGPALERTLNRFGFDHSHYLYRCTWGGHREERCACSLHLALSVLRHSGVGVDLNVKLAAELESRLGLGLDLEMPGTKFHSSTSELAATLGEIKTTVEELKTRLDAGVRVEDVVGKTDSTNAKRSAEHELQAEELKRAKHQAAMQLYKFERENPERVFKERYEVLKEQISHAVESGDVEWVAKLRGLLTRLILS